MFLNFDSRPLNAQHMYIYTTCILFSCLTMACVMPKHVVNTSCVCKCQGPHIVVLGKCI